MHCLNWCALIAQLVEDMTQANRGHTVRGIHRKLFDKMYTLLKLRWMKAAAIFISWNLNWIGPAALGLEVQ